MSKSKKHGYELSFTVKRISTRYPEGVFCVVLTLDKVYVESTNIKLEGRGADIAYETIELWAQDRIDKHSIKDVKIPSVEFLLERISAPTQPRAKTDSTNIKTITPVTNKDQFAIHAFSSMNVFRGMMRTVYREYGAERCTSVLNDGIRVLKDLAKEDREHAKNQSKADTLLAKSLFDVFKQTGISMTSQISNNEVLSQYQELISEDQKNG